MQNLEVDGAVIEYQVQGNGEPVLLIPLSLVIDGLAYPLFAQPALSSRFQLIHYHRRGYLGSTLGSGLLTIERQAGDAAALLRHLGVKAAHIAGHSIGGQIGLQLAIDAPELVHSLALLEPFLRMVPSGQVSFQHTILPVIEAYRSGNKSQAIEIFGNNIFGPNWHSIVELAVPGGVAQAVSYADLFMQELAAAQQWSIGPEQARAIRQPVLSVVGVRSDQFMREGRALLHSWLPQTEDLDVNSTHLLQMQDPQGMAEGLSQFFSRHPVS